MGAILVRGLIIYIIVLFALRIMGKREIGQLQPYELVVTIMIAELASVPMQEIGIPIIRGIIPIIALTIGQVVISHVSLKSGFLRRVFTGKPEVLIQKGKIMEDRLYKQKYTIDGLLEQLRVMGYFNIEDVEYAILETSGEISVIPKPEKRPVTVGDLNIKSKYLGFPRALVIDASLIEDNIKKMGLNNEQVEKILKDNKTTLEKTFLLMLNEDGGVFIQKKDN